MSEKKNVPKLRFPEFTEPWEQRKLGEISDKVTKKNQDVVVDEVFTNSAEYGIISQRDFFDKDIANTENIDGYYVVEPNDFVYNPRISTTAPFGPIKRNKLERSGAMSPLYYVFRPNNVDLSYLEWFFQTSCWYPFMRFNGNSGARSDRFAITDKIFNEMPISLPQDIEEQKRIGMFLTTLDTLITLHQRKLDHVKDLKKSMLQKMFPKNGQLYPEVRFPEFTDAWEQRKWIDTVDISTEMV
ncbi:MAG: restriction endonuclease subunit S, partial [Ruminococcus sp.]